MMAVLGALLKFSYQIQEHRWSDWSLQRWLVVLLTLYAGLSALGWVSGGWLATAVAVGIILLVIGFGIWARRRGFVVYWPQQSYSGSNPAAPILLPADKVLVRATGFFSVEGKTRYFATPQAYVRTFATREHAIMALIPPSRFLLLGQRSGGVVGMWYIFFYPKGIRELSRGCLWFGSTPHPAIRVQYQAESRLETVYLTFDDDISLERVLSDFHHDAPQVSTPAAQATDQTTPAGVLSAHLLGRAARSSTEGKQ